ncbi:fibronectin type III domain-containing protein [Candidatus Gottesmanbacteria bacterium]|nr:fibronectin type III domain-containing protein [Candidatus Gottesmanbacteria bacterium]
MSEETAKNGDELNIPQNKFFWIFGGIILLIAAWFGYKALISSVEDYKVTLVDAPKQVDSGSIATFTWRVDGPPTTINHTSVHMGLTSNPGDLTKEVKPADTKYTDMITDFANGKYNIPLQFVGNTKMGKVGKYYYRVHALVNDKNYWSDEASFDVVKGMTSTTSGDYKISVLYPPKSVTLPVLPKDEKEATMGGTVTFTWRIDGPPTAINNTTVYYGLTSSPGTFNRDVKPSDTKYADFVKDFINGKFDIPLQFVGNTKITDPGTYYYRVYALINGKDYWSAESSFTAK